MFSIRRYRKKTVILCVMQQSYQEGSREICPDNKACFALGMNGFRKTGTGDIKGF